MSFADIFAAAKEGTVENVKYFVEQKGTDVNLKDDDGWTPLHYAAKNNSNAEVLKYLVSQGADANAKSNTGKIPLHAAAQGNVNVEVLSYLVSLGADVRARNNNGFSPLHDAAQNNPNMEILKYLVSQGADVNAKNGNGWIPLHFAVRDNPNIEVSQYLISNGADVNAKGEADSDFTPLGVAAYKGRIDAVNVLISNGADVNAKAEGGTPLHGAAMDGHVEVAKILISAGAEINTQSWDGTPLHAAAYNGHIEFVKFLISVGADINAKNNRDLTPLDFAKNGGNPALIEYISSVSATSATTVQLSAQLQFTAEEQAEIDRFRVKFGNDITVLDENGETLLHKAVKSGDRSAVPYKEFWGVAVIRYLIGNGLDINARKNDGGTPLHLAAYFRNVEVVKFLVSDKKINVNAQDEDGKTPLNSATYKGNIEIFKTLLSHKDIDVNLPNNDGRTPLHTAVSNKHIDIVKILVSIDGIKINTKSERKKRQGDIFTDTPLHAAVFADSIELVSILVSKGADTSVKAGTMEYGGQTPLEQASFDGSSAIIEYLKSGIIVQELSLEEELAKIEAVVRDHEEKIRSGEISADNLLRQIRALASEETVAAKMKAGDKKWVEAWQKDAIRLNRIENINVSRLKALRDKHQKDSRVTILGKRAVSCYLKLHEINFLANEMMFTPDVRPQIRTQNEKLMDMQRSMWDNVFTIDTDVIDADEQIQPVPVVQEYSPQPKTAKSDIEKAREKLMLEKQNLQIQLNQSQHIKSSSTKKGIAKSDVFQKSEQRSGGSGKNVGIIIAIFLTLGIIIAAAIIVPSLLPTHEDHFNTGNSYLETERYEDAIKYFSKAIKSMPAAEYFYARGGVYTLREDHGRAIADYSEAIRLNPNSADYYFSRASAHSSLKSYRQAIEDYTSAIRLDHSDARYYNSRGGVHRMMENYDAAIADHAAAIRLNPNDARYYNNRGVAHLLKKEYDHAILNYTEAIRLASDNARYHHNRGEAYRLKRDFEPAIEDFTEAVRLDPNNSGYRSVLERTINDLNSRGRRNRR